jgi:hypothetical protein
MEARGQAPRLRCRSSRSVRAALRRGVLRLRARAPLLEREKHASPQDCPDRRRSRSQLSLLARLHLFRRLRTVVISQDPPPSRTGPRQDSQRCARFSRRRHFTILSLRPQFLKRGSLTLGLVATRAQRRRPLRWKLRPSTFQALLVNPPSRGPVLSRPASASLSSFDLPVRCAVSDRS